MPRDSDNFVLHSNCRAAAGEATAILVVDEVQAVAISPPPLTTSTVMNDPLAASDGAGRRGAESSGKGADSVRVGSLQPTPRGVIGGALQLQRSSPQTLTHATSAARHQMSGAAAGRHTVRYILANLRPDGELGRDSEADAHPLRAATARWHPAPSSNVGPRVSFSTTSGTPTEHMSSKRPIFALQPALSHARRGHHVEGIARHLAVVFSIEDRGLHQTESLSKDERSKDRRPDTALA